MKKADSFTHSLPGYGGRYPNSWAGYVHLQQRTAENRPDLRHLGDDYNGPGGGNSDIGMDVVAVAAGVVEACIFWDGKSYGFGNHIFIRHELEDKLYEALKARFGIDSRILYSHYAHLDKIAVRAGDEVDKGQLIGKCGNSGTTYGHEHNEIRKATGLGYESYPSARPVDWINQYYFTPFTTIEAFKDPIPNPPPITETPTTTVTSSTSSSTTRSSTSSSSTTTEIPLPPPPPVDIPPIIPPETPPQNDPGGPLIPPVDPTPIQKPSPFLELLQWLIYAIAKIYDFIYKKRR